MNDYLPDKLLKPALPLASKTSRWVASLVDYGFYAAIFILVVIYFGEKYTTESGAVGYRTSGLPAICIMACWWIFFPILEGLTGQTLGKALFNIKVVKEAGSKAAIGNCMVRHLFDLVDFLPFAGIAGLLVAAGSQSRQRVGDLVAKTAVVKAKNK